jgi:hypothetical protein
VPDTDEGETDSEFCDHVGADRSCLQIHNSGSSGYLHVQELSPVPSQAFAYFVPTNLLGISRRFRIIAENCILSFQFAKKMIRFCVTEIRGTSPQDDRHRPIA